MEHLLSFLSRDARELLFNDLAEHFNIKVNEKYCKSCNLTDVQNKKNTHPPPASAVRRYHTPQRCRKEVASFTRTCVRCVVCNLLTLHLTAKTDTS